MTVAQNHEGDGIELIIRTANVLDLDSLVDLHHTSFTRKTNIITRLGEKFIRTSYEWFIASEETYVIVAELNNLLVGLTAVCDRPYVGPLLKNCWIEALTGSISHPAIIFDKMIWSHLFNLLLNYREKKGDKPDLSNSAHLAYIAVHPGYQGKKVGTKLLNHSKEIALKRGKIYHYAGVYRNNTNSQRMFEACGHVILKESEIDNIIVMRAELT
jgi:ribosomal protein S18 acetylase RimI-like enzyme